MTFPAAVRTCLAKYVTFAGRAPRSEFWYFQLFTVLAVYLIPVGVYLAEPATGKVAGIAIAVLWLLLYLPNISVAVRRLHDRNRSGWNYLWMFVPFFGSIVLLIWWCQRGVPGENRFGPDPLAFDLALSPPPPGR